MAARQRFIWPTLWDDPDFGKLDERGRLLFIAIFSMADDDGRIQAHPANLRGIAFKYDDLTLREIRDIRDRVLEVMRSVQLYVVDGEEYIQLHKWTTYQHPKYPKPSLLPPPPGYVPPPRSDEDSSTGPAMFDEDGNAFPQSSPNLPPIDHQTTNETDAPSSVGWVGMGRDGSGRDGIDTPPTPPAGGERDDDQEFAAFWLVYPRRIDKGAARKAWRARRKEGCSAEEMIGAATTYAQSKAGEELRFVKHPATFLGPSKPFREWAQGPPEGERSSGEPQAFEVLRRYQEAHANDPQ